MWENTRQIPRSQSAEFCECFLLQLGWQDSVKIFGICHEGLNNYLVV